MKSSTTNQIILCWNSFIHRSPRKIETSRDTTLSLVFQSFTQIHYLNFDFRVFKSKLIFFSFSFSFINRSKIKSIEKEFPITSETLELYTLDTMNTGNLWIKTIPKFKPYISLNYLVSPNSKLHKVGDIHCYDSRKH
jgi:hypothetical protein